MLEAVKTALCISSDYYNAELTTLIAAAIADLKLAGVSGFTDSDPLIITAVACYCQANRGTDGDSRTLFAGLYANQKRNLMLAGEYHDAD